MTPPHALLTVAQCVNTLDMGGVEQLALTLACRLDGHRFRSLICCVEERGTLADQAEHNGVKVHALRMQQVGKWNAFQSLCGLLRQRQPCVIHSHNFKPFYYAALARARGAADRHVHTRHGAFTRDHRFPWRYRLMRHWADELVTVSADGRLKLSRSTGLPLKNINVLPNGVDTELFCPATDKSAARRALNLPESALATVNVARQSAEKDLPTLLRAFALITPTLPNSELWLVGDGSERPMLETLARDLRIDAQTRFLGARHDVPEILRAADVFALSSISEGLSIALIEAAATGLPIVATDVGGNREIVEPEKTGLLVPAQQPQALADALSRLLREPTTRAQMAAVGRARAVERFSLQRMIEHYSTLYSAARR